MNNIMTSVRSCLQVKTMSSLMFIKCVDPPRHLFNPKCYARKWIEKHASADDLKARAKAERSEPECVSDYKVICKILA